MKNMIMVVSALLAFGVFGFRPACKRRDPSVSVDYEYGDLKEVIVGLPYGMSPSLEAKWFADALSAAGR